jgi:hypothetical protein
MPAPRELPPPDPAMTERVVAAALEALPPPVRRRRRVLSLIAIAMAVAIAIGLAAGPSQSRVPRYPLSFVSIHHGGAPVPPFATRPEVKVFALAQTTFAAAEGFANILELGAPAVAALDRVDFNYRFVIFAVRRNRGLVVRKLKLRPLAGGLQLCVYFRDRNTGTDGQLFGYDIVSVRKTGPLQGLGQQLAVAGIVLFDGRGTLVQYGPLGRLRPALCR